MPFSYDVKNSKRILALSKPKDSSPMDIPRPNLGPRLLPTPPIPPIYVAVPPPTSYQGKSLESCISQPIEVYLDPPTK